MIVKLFIKKFKNRIKRSNPRMWYDILAFDYTYSWLPVNIKITTTTTSDNTGNWTMCVYAYTNEFIDIHRNRTYQNGEMSIVLFNKIKNKEYNKLNKRDYYFIVLNKKNSNDIIINSLKGLTTLTPNINNLPFQICWNKNRIYNYKPVKENIKMFIQTLQNPRPSWKEIFLTNMRTLS